MTIREDAIELGRDAMGRNDLYEIAEEAYFAHADMVSTNGIGAAVDAVLDALRAQDDSVADVIALLGGESE